MTHELKHIVEKAIEFQQQDVKSILATVVALNGSSYRKPGVRMLITEDGQMVGAVSGGCVERDVYAQAQSVFKTGIPKVMTYDGRYRLGCEGLLYILIEPIHINTSFQDAFKSGIQDRSVIEIRSYFVKSESTSKDYGTVISFQKGSLFSLRNDYSTEPHLDLQVFKQSLEPRFRLYIFGGEHDAIKLCTMAHLLGWEVNVVTSVKDPKTIADFPGANSVIAQTPELAELDIDDDTAVMLMNHNYVLDLKYVLKMQHFKPKYIGVLGSSKRREKLINELFEHNPNFNSEVLDHLYSPAGLHIGSVTPEEIALSILAEILSVYRGVSPNSLRDLKKNR
jgi:xanthine/CO dehydrogenase XdhC/CoxF family maturation factor